MREAFLRRGWSDAQECLPPDPRFREPWAAVYWSGYVLGRKALLIGEDASETPLRALAAES